MTVTALLRTIGLDITGLTLSGLLCLYLPLMYWLARRRIGFHWSPSVVRLLDRSHFAVCVTIDLLVHFTRWGASIQDWMCGFFFFARARARPASRILSDLGGPAGRIGAFAQPADNPLSAHPKG